MMTALNHTDCPSRRWQRLLPGCTVAMACIIGFFQSGFLPADEGWGAMAALAQEEQDAPKKELKDKKPDPGPAEWRDNSQPELREHWDTLEGKPATELTGLKHWLQTDARSWNDYRGKVVLLDYWATWCGPCRQEIPRVVEMYGKYHDKGFEVLGVHSARGFEKMPDFVKEEKLPYGFAADPDRVLGTELGIKFIPCYFLIDRNGIMRVAGANREKLEEIVDALVAENGGTGAGNDGWPVYVKKNLYANDFRGQKAPELVVEQWLTDKPETNGKIVMIDFWATWCGPCRKLIPEVNEFQKKFKDDMVIIGLSGDSTIDKVRNFMKTTEMHYSQAVDTQKRTSLELGIKGIPHVIILSTDGIIRWQGFPLSEEEPLTEGIIKSIIERDPGVAARRAAEREKAKKNEGRG